MKKLFNHRYTFIFAAIITALVIIFFRLHNLGSIPAGITKDETYYGYDAYSILETGKDIWGVDHPLFFKSTGEYKLNLTYLVSIAVKIFGLTAYSVRLPSAIFGLLTLIVLYLTLRQGLKRSRIFSLVFTLIFAFSPWSFGMSRLFYESNVGLFFMALGVYFSFNKRLSYSATFFALASYLYSPYRYIGLAFLIISLLFTKLKNRTRILSLTLYLLLIAPLLFAGPRGTSLNRLEEELLLQKTSYELTINEKRANCKLLYQSPLFTKGCYLFWNKGVLHLASATSSIVRVLSPEALFISADNPYFLPPNYGMYLSYLLPLYLLGIIWLFQHHESATNRLKYLLLAGVIISASVVSATGNIEFYRHPVLMYFLFLFIAQGASLLIKYLSRYGKQFKFFALASFALVGTFQTSKYLATYFTYTPTLPLLFASDVEEVYAYLHDHRDYQYLVDKIYHGPITAAFLWQLDPAYYQGNVVWTDPDSWGFINASRLDNIYSQTYTIESLLCLKHKNPDQPLRALIIDNPGIYSQAAALLTHDFSGSLTLHAVYDIDTLYPYVLEHDPAALCQLDSGTLK